MTFRTLSPFSSSFATLRRTGIVCATVGIALLIGCGAGPSAAPLDVPITSFGGAVHGGQSPIQGAIVSLYVTQASATAYGQAATLIGTATTDIGGNFTISPSATPLNCPAGQQAYVTAAGGYQSGQATLVNNSMLEVAALGDCGHVNTSTHVIVNEVTTVAAAYALSGFASTTLDGTSGLYVANISAPAANNTAAANVSGTASAGLAHAFLNAANLVDYASGMPRSSITVSSNGTTQTGSVPYVEILTIADILQSCVDGATGNANCTNLFKYTPSIAGNAPANTFQAAINLARNPFNVTYEGSLLGLISGFAAFQPTLTASPADWSLSIVYGVGSLPVGYQLALDADDTVYVGTSSVSSAGTPALIGLSAYGNTPPAFATLPAGSASKGIAPDALGNIWVANGSTGLYEYPGTVSSGNASSPTSYATLDFAYPVAVDAANNVWVGHSIAGSANIDEFAYSGGTWTSNYTAQASSGPNDLRIDASQNVWAAPYFSHGTGDTTQAAMIPNTGTVTVPVYTLATTGGTALNVLSATFAGSASEPFGVSFDASGNAWYTIYGSGSYGTSGLEEVIPSATLGATSLAPQPFIYGSESLNAAGTALGTSDALFAATDGAGTVFIPDNNDPSFGIHAYLTQTNTSGGTQVASPFHGYKSCYLATTSTTVCGTNNMAAVYNAQQVVIDSTGSLWAPSGSGGVTQIIGIAAPTYPLAAAGKPGLSPGLTRASTLP